MGESYITAGGYFNLNLNAGSDPDVTERRGKLFQGSIVREKKENLLVLSRTKGLVYLFMYIYFEKFVIHNNII